MLEPPTPPKGDASQTRHPWRATARTTIAALWGLIPVLPYIATSARIETVPAIASVLAVTAAVTRVASDPRIEAYIETYIPWLAADPLPKEDNDESGNEAPPAGRHRRP